MRSDSQNIIDKDKALKHYSINDHPINPIPQKINQDNALNSIERIPNPLSSNDQNIYSSVKQIDTESSQLSKKDNNQSLISSFKMSSPRFNSELPKHIFNSDEQDIKKPEPIQIDINMNVNNYFSLYIDPALKKKFQEVKEKKKYSCNCKRSKCLKLYCDCFANGEFCLDCNCQSCSNVIGNDKEIKKAFNEVKDKNPVAMKFNISEETTTLGCNCTKSNCLKKYCECFKANLACTDQCRCRDCINCSKIIDDPRKINNNPVKPAMKQNVYDKYSFQKISVMIADSVIYTEQYDDIKINNFPIKKQQVNVRIKNHETFIEIPKSLLTGISFNQSHNRTDMFLGKKQKNDSLSSLSEEGNSKQ